MATAVPALRLVAGWLPAVLRKANRAPFGADQASEMLVVVIAVACREDADRALVKRTVTLTGRPAVTRTVGWLALW
jgi:hypothetical protein